MFKYSFNDYRQQFLIYKERGVYGTYLSFKRRIKKKLGYSQLGAIFISPSHECNANCVHCYERFEAKKKISLSTETIKDIIDQFKKLDGGMVYFCSGEFLLRPDAIDLIKYAHAKKIRVSVTSNGLLLDEKKIDELKAAGLRQLVVSIDSAEEERHDELRGVKGCYQKATNALKMANEKGILTQIWSYVTKTNFKELQGVSDLAVKLGTPYVFVFFPLLSGKLFNCFDENLTFEEREEFRKKFNRKDPVTLEFPTEKSLCRGGGNEHINIMPTGDVTFCPPVPYSYGNIHEKSLKEILEPLTADFKKFCTHKCTGQCIVNFPEYRKDCNAKFIYPEQSKTY